MHTETPSYQTATLRRHRFFSIGTEAILTLAVCVLVAYLAQPLAVPHLDVGLGERYTSGDAPATWIQLRPLTDGLFSRLGDDPRATLLLRTAGVWLPAFGLLGLGLLHCARAARGWAGGLIVLGWSALATLWRPFGLPGSAGAAGAVVGLCLLLLAFRRAADVPHGTPNSSPGSATVWNSLVWPGWVLLTGIGWLWVADFAARGPVAAFRPGAKYFGLHQADAIFLADAIVLFAAAKSATLVKGFARLVAALAAIWKQPRGPLVMLTLGSAFAFALGWLGHRINPPLPVLHIAGGGMPYISGELLRLVAGVALSWAAYRFGEWHSSGRRLWRGMVCTAAVGVLCLFGLGVSGDMGPILILALALLLFLAAPLVKIVTRIELARPARRSQALTLAVLGIAILVSGGIWLWRTAVTEWAPQFSRTAALREAARQDPFGANSPNLAQAHWLMDAARNVGGFGLGRVPYCGARAHIEAAVCTLGSGAPIQLPSDFAFAGLAATWGIVGAAACIAVLFAWLRALVLSAMPSHVIVRSAALGPQESDNPLSWLRAWLVAVPCLIAQAQILVSVGGVLAWTPLTGVTLPLLGYGTVALCVAALWVGLAVRPISDGAAVNPNYPIRTERI